MALFVVTGILSLSAGLGIGALLPPHHEHPKTKLLKSQGPVPHIKVASSSVPQRIPAPKKQALPSDKILDFTDFDKSLLKLVENKNPPKLQGGQSTLKKSVVENSEFYSPPTVVEELQGGQTLSPTQNASTKKLNRFETSWF